MSGLDKQGSPSPDQNIHTYITISWGLQIITDYIFVYLTKARIGQWRVIVGFLDYFVEMWQHLSMQYLCGSIIPTFGSTAFLIIIKNCKHWGKITTGRGQKKSQEIFFCPKIIFCFNKVLVKKKCLSKNIFRPKYFCIRNILCPTNFQIQNKMCRKNNVLS